MRKLAFLSLMLVPMSAAVAQSKATEISLNVASLGIDHQTGGSQTNFSITSPGVAVGFYLSNSMAIEPMVRLDWSHVTGSSSTNLDVGAALPFYMKKDFGHTGLFVAPMAGIMMNKYTGSASVNRVHFGAAIGTKSKMSDNVSLKLSLNGQIMPKKDTDPSHTMVSANVGFSVFLK